MKSYQQTLFSSALAVLPALAVVALGLALAGTGTAQSQEPRSAGLATAEAVMPAYDGDGRLLLPEDYLRWVFVGSSLGLSYSEGGGGMEMFHHTLMEPTAYEHFSRTGEFRDGTMFVLMLHGQGEGELPQRRGRFAAEVHGVEMAIKDSRTFDERWAYFGFGARDGLRDRAEAFGRSSCYDCHAEHAAHDNVFVQFYPLLRGAAPAGSAVRTASLSDGAESSASVSATDPPPLALAGLDPVHLSEGREELGKAELVASHGGYRYQFVTEPTRARFAADPERYAIQNDSCPVVPGASIDPSLFQVYEGRIYAFATEGCAETFRERPEDFVEGEEAQRRPPAEDLTTSVQRMK